ncbi:F-box/LRR-repeat protein At4g29420-like isoform X2 [Corylus avellana]|uniref:F-box/LRR-repeat protein At4g29420-like isoform X2 n=1 Tax=Corylus avellana TaxID=13451 RepID=UPI00286A8001|nr:F-box/LRR-repeat protein At4g29420-like isoform X2 [Corylus avellana]
MEELPPSLIVDILSRLTDSDELARCRLVSKTFNSLSYEVRSVRLLCTLSRYLKSRAPETKFLVTPFKNILKTLVCDSQFLESVFIGVDKSLGNVAYDDVEDESDDLYLTDVRFVKEWLPRIAGRLRSLSVSDFWFQSCWRKSEVLSLISSCCHTLLKLEVKNAWLSVDGLNPMPTLTSLTLEFVRLDDEDLNKSLVLETPSLSDFHLTLEEANEFKVKGFPHLKNLQLQSVDLCRLICMFPSGRTIKKLSVDSPHQKMTRFSLETVFDVFPNLSYLNLGVRAWMQAEDYFSTRGLEGRIGMKALKEIVAHMVTVNEDVTLSFIFSILDKCANLSDMALMIYPQIGFLTASDLVSRCRAAYPRVAWKWEMLKEGTADA